MSYITLAQLADSPGATELAQAASREHSAIVDAALMELTLRGGDRSAYDAADIEVADDALARIEQIVAEVDQTLYGYIAKRQPQMTPDAMPVPSVLTRIARALVRYDLRKDQVGDGTDGKHPVIRDYYDKLRLLEAIRDGKVTLGIDDPAAAPSDADGGAVRMTSNPRLFSRASLGAL